jgi:mycofactocin system glycosyltransferase
VSDDRSRSVAASLLRSNQADPDLAVRPAPGADVLTVVVPVRDRSVQLAACLASLRQGPGHALQVLVVDDASHDPDAIERACRAHTARRLRLDTNVGPAGARNTGLAQVRTPFVAFVDSDVTVTAEVLLSLVRHFADPDVALVAPMVASRSRSTRPRWFERYDEVSSSLALGHVGCSVRPGAAVAWLPSACLVGRAEALSDGFDVAMRVGEDVDLVWRLTDAGAVVRYDPTHTAWHDTRTTLRSWLGRKFVYGTGGAALAERHGDKCATAVLRPVVAVGAAALLMRRWWSLPVAFGCVLHGARAVERALPVMAGRRGLAGRLAVRGLGWAVRQESALVLRHWWPPAAALCLVSRHARRVAVSALLVDTVVSHAGSRGVPAHLAAAGRRLDDAAYGAGLWAGSFRNRTSAALRTRARAAPTTQITSRAGARRT